MYNVEDLSHLKRLIVDKTAELFEAERVSLMLFDEDSQTLRIAESVGISSEVVNNTAIKLGEDIAGLSLKEKKLFFVENIYDLSRKYGLKVKKNIVSPFLIVIPLYVVDKLVGTLNVTKIKKPDNFTKRDREIILSVSSHVALSIDRINLIDFQKVKMNQAMTLFEISKTLNSFIDIDETLESLIGIISNILDIRKISIYMFNQSTRRFIIKISEGFDNVELNDIEFILKNKREDFIKGKHSFLKIDADCSAYFFLPLNYENDLIGMLCISKKDSEREHDVRFLGILASQLAVIIGKEIILERLRKEKEKFRVLNFMSKEMSTCFEVRKTVDILKENLRFMFDYDIACLLVFKTDYSKADLFFDSINTQKNDLVKSTYDIVTGFLRLNRKGLGNIDIRTHGIEPEILMRRNIDNVGSHLIMPLIEGEQLKGIFFIGARDNDNITIENDLELFSIIGNYIASTLEKSYLFKENERLAFTDSMTGTYNYRFFKNRIEEEFLRCRRYSKTMTLLILDIDHFKFFNDNFGHQQGDSVLRETALTIKENVRSIDTLARYGGEEFVVILPETSLEEGVVIAERIRSCIENKNYKNIVHTGKKLHITVSIGIAELKDNISNVREFIDISDACLYKAKNNGRNRVCYYDRNEYKETKNTNS
jgi:diguanylate cyclase (GGDEF)-like protein